MLVFMVTKDDLDRYGIWKTFIGSKQPSLTQMLEFGKWAVFKPIGLLMQATIIDFNNDDDALESSETIEISTQYPQSTTVVPKSPGPATAPPPPPPPPPPCPVIKNRIEQENDEPKCKKLSWKELKIDLRNTVWEKVNQQLLSLVDVIDKNEVFELFKEKPRKSRKFSAQSPVASMSEEIQTIGGKKQLNISIALAHHQLSADNLFNAINNVDIGLIEADFLSSMESFLPDQTEETSLMRKFSSTNIAMGSEILTDPERFSLLLSSVPEYRKKIRAMVFQCSFYDRVNAICQNLDIVRDAAREIRHSSKLETALLYILSLGRLMNNSSTEAFNIDFLSSASCFKSADGDTTFLMYLVQKLTTNDSEALQLAEELPTLQQAVKVSLNDIDRDSTELAVEYGSLALELDSIIEESQAFKEFLRQGKFDLNHLKRKRRQVQQDLKDLTGYFGIDPNRSQPMNVFSTLNQFIKDLMTANENLSKKVLSRKNSSRAMMRSTSVPSFKRSSRNSSFRGSRNSSAKSSRNSSARSSFRKVSRSISIASSTSDVTNGSQDGLQFRTRHSRNSSRDVSSENASLCRDRVVESPRSRTFKRDSVIEGSRLKFDNEDKIVEGSSLTPSKYDDEGYGSFSRSLTPKTRQFLKSELMRLEKERLKEPDLSKYRDFVNQRKKEDKQKSNHSTDLRDTEKPQSHENHRYDSKEREEKRKALLSPVRENSNVKKVLERERGSNSIAGAVNGSDKDNRFSKEDFVSKFENDKDLRSKQYSVANSYDEVKEQKEKEVLDADVKPTRAGLRGRNDDFHWDEIREKLRRRKLEKERIARASDKNEPNEQECVTERGKELKTLRCRMKMPDGKQCLNTSEKEKKVKENIERSNRILPIQMSKDSGTEKDSLSRNGLSVKVETHPQNSRLSANSDDGKQRKIEKDSESPMNGKVHNASQMKIKRDDPLKERASQKGSLQDSSSKIEGKSNKDGNQNITKSFIRGGTRSSLTRNRSSLRNSFKSDRGLRKVSVKAMLAKDVHKMVARAKSESHAGDAATKRRRTKSEGLQAVILKPGLIAEDLPLKVDLENSDANNDNKQKLNNGTSVGHSKDFAIVDDISLKDTGPVLRRTKSAIINRNVREAKIVFFL
ncbi:formin-J-like [Rhopilema esculentum]|uniref:formin-J-like n=1 Tax=Rhopilema esculentum TaxID=499914 RepID=UPI0031D9C287